jgi:teichoic acid ribitol-phosphate primase
VPRSVIATVRILLVRVTYAVASRLPLRSRVVLATSHSDRLLGNLVWIREELARREPPIPTVTLAFESRRGLRGQAAGAWNAVRSAWYLATSRAVVVDDYFFAMYVIRPRSGTTFVQAWHGSGAFKKFGYSVLDRGFGADDELIRRVAIHSNYDVCLVSSMSVAPYYAEAFRQPLDRFVSHLGIPRTDLFFDPERVATAAARIRARYGIPPDRRVILYAPTFRGESVTRARFEDHLDLSILREELGEDHVVLVRLHPFIRDRAGLGPALRDFAIDVSDWPDMNELMLVSDILVTDYSSAIYEFALLGRPIVFFAPDQEAYVRERGFYMDFPADAPGPVFERSRELAGYLRAGEFDLERVHAFRQASFDVADGRATARLVDELLLPALGARESNGPGRTRAGRAALEVDPTGTGPASPSRRPPAAPR